MIAGDPYPQIVPGLGGGVLCACLSAAGWGLAVSVDMVGMGCSG